MEIERRSIRQVRTRSNTLIRDRQLGRPEGYDWREQHLRLLAENYRAASHFNWLMPRLKPSTPAPSPRSACAVLGIECLHLPGVNSGDFRQNGETTRIFIDLVREVQPAVVYTHFTTGYPSGASRGRPDRHLRHEAVKRQNGSPHRKCDLGRLCPELVCRRAGVSVRPQGGRPLRQHHSQLGRWDRNGLSLVEATAAMGRFRGSRIGERYAKAFVLYRRIVP